MDRRAEYILTAIGAGATATTEFDWHKKWVESKEAAELQDELEARTGVRVSQGHLSVLLRGMGASAGAVPATA